MTTVRRIALILACAAVAVTATASPVAAHPLPTVSQVPVGRPGTVTIGIPAETTTAMTGVDIDIPAGYRVIKLEPPPGWTANLTPQRMRYAHGNVVPGSFALISFRGVASKRGPLKFDLTTHSANGHSQLWNGVQGKDAYPAPVVYAGVPLPVTAGKSGPSGLRLAGWGLIVLGVVLLGVVAVSCGRPARKRRTKPTVVAPVEPAPVQRTDEIGTGAGHP